MREGHTNNSEDKILSLDYELGEKWPQVLGSLKRWRNYKREISLTKRKEDKIIKVGNCHGK